MKTFYWIFAVAVLSVGLLFTLKNISQSVPITTINENPAAEILVAGEYDGFAKCIKDSGAVFYGAFWCPHCQDQKKEFGSSAKFLPYVECSTSDGRGQTEICKEKEIMSYPTWVFKDGSKITGKVEMLALAAKTKCEMPKIAADVKTATGTPASL